MRRLFLVAMASFSMIAMLDSASAQVRTGISHPTYGSTHGYTIHEHAGDHVRLMYHYARTRPNVPSRVVLTHTKAVRGNIQAARRINEGLAKAKPDDEKAQKILKSIAGHQKAALKHVKEIEAATKEKESVDSETVAKHSKLLYGSIRAALKHHEELHKHLGGEKLTEIED